MSVGGKPISWDFCGTRKLTEWADFMDLFSRPKRSYDDSQGPGCVPLFSLTGLEG